MRQELRNLNELQFDLEISMAELQANIAVKKRTIRHRRGRPTIGLRTIVGRGAGAAANPRDRIVPCSCAGSRRTSAAWSSKKKDETEQQVLQLRNLRAQLRQLESESEQNKPRRRLPARIDRAAGRARIAGWFTDGALPGEREPCLKRGGQGGPSQLRKPWGRACPPLNRALERSGRTRSGQVRADPEEGGAQFGDDVGLRELADPRQVDF